MLDSSSLSPTYVGSQSTYLALCFVYIRATRGPPLSSLLCLACLTVPDSPGIKVAGLL